MNGTIVLATERLLLRSERMEDAAALHRLFGCDPEITRYTGWNPYLTLADAREKVTLDIVNAGKPGWYAWIIQHGPEIVGTIGAYDYDPDSSAIELGYSIVRAAWGQGFATEAVSAVLRYLLEAEKINRVHAWCHSDNIASARVLEKSGFRQEGVQKQSIRNADGTLSDRRLYGVVYDEWKQHQST